MRKLLYKDISKSFKLNGYTLLSKSYVGNHKYLKFRCPNGHIHKITWASWNRGRRCYYCSNKITSIDYNDVKKSFINEGYKLLSKKYVNYDIKLKFICNKNHSGSMSWGNWKSGRRCSICYFNSMRNSYEKIKKSFETEGYKLLTKKYINCEQYLNFICPKGHRHRIIWESWRIGRRCGVCSRSKSTSKGEKEVANYVKSIGFEIKENDKTILFNKKTGKFLELDIWMPKLNKAIEYNGDYWHKKYTYTDKLKKLLCKNKNIKLLIIKECEWKSNMHRCKNNIKNFIRKDLK